MALILSYTTTDSTKQGPQSALRSYYQSFIPDQLFSITGLEINIDSVVAGTAKAIFEIYAADADGKPTGAALCDGTLDTVDTGWQGDLTLSSNPNLSSGSRYCFRIKGKAVSGEYHFDFDSTDGYADGTCWYWDGSQYVAQNGDINFKIYGTALLPGAPTNPSPGDDTINITLDETPLSWDASDPAADTYEIYFREQGDAWGLVGVAQAGVEWAVEFGTLAYGTTYEWRVDATNIYDTTTGDTWTFTCLAFAPPRASYVLIPGGSGAGPYDDPPGEEGTDWNWTGENTALTVKRLIAAARNRIYYEDV